MDWRSVVVVVAPAPSATDELGAGCAVVEVVLATVVVTAAAVVEVVASTARHRFLSSSAAVVHVIGTRSCNRFNNSLLTTYQKTSNLDAVTQMSAQFRLADLTVPGGMTAAMTRLHVETGSWEEVARRLLVEHGVRVSGQTLRRWAEQLGIGAAA